MKVYRHATIYERRGSLYIRSSSQTDVGLWLEQGPCILLSADSAPDAIGEATRSALADSGSIIPHPTEWTSVDLDNPILEMAGIRRWSAFRRGSLSVGVWQGDGKLEITPSVNEGSQGFAHLDDDTLHLPADASADALGTAINKALKCCK